MAPRLITCHWSAPSLAQSEQSTPMSNFSWNELDRGCMEYIDWIWKLRFKEWKYELHKYYKYCLTLEAVRGTLLRSFWRGWVSGTKFGTHFESEKYKLVRIETDVDNIIICFGFWSVVVLMVKEDGGINGLSVQAIEVVESVAGLLRYLYSNPFHSGSGKSWSHINQILLASKENPYVLKIMDQSNVGVVKQHFEKPEKFKGVDFKHWQQKMFFYLTTLNFSHIITSETPEAPEERDMLAEILQAIEAWITTAKDPWESMDKKYKFEVASSKKFMIENSLNYKMSDTKFVVKQVEELQVIVHELDEENLGLKKGHRAKDYHHKKDQNAENSNQVNIAKDKFVVVVFEVNLLTDSNDWGGKNDSQTHFWERAFTYQCSACS
ncbi:hypothetical protein D8674_037547 [Pyrus ussuriensis x Pyrus communis]|uniref:Uncharacterized protein n=1 Tax=Pyrus ussuriensis x Pyrus communis TaxID=2448454 RepID=A0A5N5GHY9_9ROSA|nr:hypothetical protein D8674_037547 [Pyrus ussuriensis x Pyrus communis]